MIWNTLFRNKWFVLNKMLKENASFRATLLLLNKWTYLGFSYHIKYNKISLEHFVGLILPDSEEWMDVFSQNCTINSYQKISREKK